jgi:hypothetical protein
MKPSAQTKRLSMNLCLCFLLIIAAGTSGCQTCQPVDVSEAKAMENYGFTKKPEPETPPDLFNFLSWMAAFYR